MSVLKSFISSSLLILDIINHWFPTLWPFEANQSTRRLLHHELCMSAGCEQRALVTLFDLRGYVRPVMKISCYKGKDYRKVRKNMLWVFFFSFIFPILLIILQPFRFILRALVVAQSHRLVTTQGRYIKASQDHAFTLVLVDIFALILHTSGWYLLSRH